MRQQKYTFVLKYLSDLLTKKIEKNVYLAHKLSNQYTLGKQRHFRVVVMAPRPLKWRSKHLRGPTSGTKFGNQKSNDHGSGRLYLKGCVFLIMFSILEANAPVMPMLFLANSKLILIFQF